MTGSSDRMDLVDALQAWTEVTEEHLTEEDAEAILRIMLAIDESRFSRVPVSALSGPDFREVREMLHDVDAHDFTDWVLDETLAEFSIVEPQIDESVHELSEHATDDLQADAGDPTIVWDPEPAHQAVTHNRSDAESGSEPAGEEALGNTREVDEPTSDVFDLDELDHGNDLDGGEIDPDLDDHHDPDDGEIDPDLDDRHDPDDGEAGDRVELAAEVGDVAKHTDTSTESDTDPSTESDTSADPEAEAGGGAKTAFTTAAKTSELERDFLADIGNVTTISAKNTPDSGDAEPDRIDADAIGNATGRSTRHPTRHLARVAVDPMPADGLGGAFLGSSPQLASDGLGESYLAEPLSLRSGPDELGPTFLDPPKPNGLNRFLIGALSLVAVTAFVLAGADLIRNIDEGPDSSIETAAESADAEVADGAQATDGTAPDNLAAEEANADQNDSEASEGDDAADASPTAIPIRGKQAIVRTEAGTVHAVELLDDGIGESIEVYRAPEDIDGADATFVAPVGSAVAVVTSAGDIELIDFNDPATPSRIWSADDLGPALQVARAANRYIVLEGTGSVSLFEAGQPASTDALDRIWDVTLGGIPPVREIHAYRDLVPMVLANGDVELLVTSLDGDPVVAVWNAETQPKASNGASGTNGLLMGVGDGAIARYLWVQDGNPLQAVWNPFDGSRLPAIGYAPVDNSAAVVLNSGTVVMVDEAGESAQVWSSDETDRPAIGAMGSPTELLLAFEGGVIERVDFGAENTLLGTVWGSEASSSPAAQVFVLTAN